MKIDISDIDPQVIVEICDIALKDPTRGGARLAGVTATLMGRVHAAQQQEMQRAQQILNDANTSPATLKPDLTNAASAAGAAK